MKLHTYFDASYASDHTTLKSHSGSLHKLAGGVITATSKQQSIVAQSSTEAEYVAGARNAMESAYIRQVLEELGYTGEDAKVVETYGDNQGSLSLAENPEFHQRTKYIAVKYHYIREEVRKGNISLFYVPTKEMAADSLTKPLNAAMHARFVEMLGMKPLDTSLIDLEG